ncbi:MAG: hypothetical protein ACLTZT_16680 [Butyricimonas faecalis]
MVPKSGRTGAIDPAGISTASVGKVFRQGPNGETERQLLISLVGNRGRWLLPIMGYATLQKRLMIHRGYSCRSKTDTFTGTS